MNFFLFCQIVIRQQSLYTHSGNSSTHHGWATPQELLAKLYEVFGVFDLDPCSPTRTRRHAPVKARAYFTMADDGLQLPWFGTVFVNPPYGRTLKAWVAKAYQEVMAGHAQTVVMLQPARTDTRFWHEYVGGRALVFFLKGRLRFGDGEQAAPFPSCLAVWGGSDEMIAALQAVLPEAWVSW